MNISSFKKVIARIVASFSLIFLIPFLYVYIRIEIWYIKKIAKSETGTLRIEALLFQLYLSVLILETMVLRAFS